MTFRKPQGRFAAWKALHASLQRDLDLKQGHIKPVRVVYATADERVHLNKPRRIVLVGEWSKEA